VVVYSVPLLVSVLFNFIDKQLIPYTPNPLSSYRLVDTWAFVIVTLILLPQCVLGIPVKAAAPTTAGGTGGVVLGGGQVVISAQKLV
jgi:hypothetical protein